MTTNLQDFTFTDDVIRQIQPKIGYTFKNPKLLSQAFTRKSYTEEDSNALNNEVLEFYGDKVLDFIVMKKMSEYYGGLREDGQFSSYKDEGQLTEIKKRLVCKEMLAKKIRELDLHSWLIMGVSDSLQRINMQESVQEDLFEAILGAVAIDSDWDIENISRVVERLLNPDFYFKNGFDEKIDYIQLVQQWQQKKSHTLPQYSTTPCVRDFYLYSEFNGECGYQSDLSLIPFCFPFKGLGKNKKEAMMAAAKKAYQYLEINKLLISPIDEIGEPDINKSINQLQELYQKQYISEPRYSFEETHDENGNPIWDCECYVDSLNHGFLVKNSSKKQAKKEAAYLMTYLFLGEIDNNET